MYNNLRSFLVRVVLPSVLVATLSFHSFAQHEPNVSENRFLMTIELYNDVVKLTCNQGCTWDELAFTLHVDMNVDISHLGLGEGIGDYDDYGIADFRFNIKRSSEGISLESKNGTSWNNLSFTCRPNECHHAIDQNGMTSVK